VDLGLAGKRAVVTGGSRGIGLAVARALAAEGADVALLAREVNSAAEPRRRAPREPWPTSSTPTCWPPSTSRSWATCAAPAPPPRT
jgi:hypothetical protein